MAGNVAEWCSNAVGRMRGVRGGSYSDPYYMYISRDAAAPFDRSPNRGFRCAKYTAAVPAVMAGALPDRSQHDYGNDQPVGDDVFASYRSIYAYDRAPLEARLESSDTSSPWWKRERVSFAAAYGNERVTAFVLLPKTGSPPYQTMVLFPGGTAAREHTSENLELRRVDYVVQGGRAVVYPVFKGTYERFLPSPPAGPNEQRDLLIQWAKDAGRTGDYIATRQDLDSSRIAFMGASLGAGVMPVFAALDPRIRTVILQGGGLDELDLPGEARRVNFLPRVKCPVLMMNGKDDFFNPLREIQIPMFRLFGTPPKDKRHVLMNSGHALPRIDTIREVLAWLDRYLGPVEPPAR